jgi:hypothetical protein
MRRIDHLIVQVDSLLFRDKSERVGRSLYDRDESYPMTLSYEHAKLTSSVAEESSSRLVAIPADNAIAAAGGKQSPGTSETRLRLTVDSTSPGNRWPGHPNSAELWASTGAVVDLVFGAEGRFAALEVVAGEGIPPNWRFETVALGPDELPDPHRKVGNAKKCGMRIPLVSSREFRLDQPIRVALHVSDAGQTTLGCLVFVSVPGGTVHAGTAPPTH